MNNRPMKIFLSSKGEKMSVGDIKGARRRTKLLKRKGHYPKVPGLSVQALIQRNKDVAARAAKIKKG